MKHKAGDTVALTQCRVWVSTDDSEPTERYMSGLFQLENWEPRDPAAYQWESGWIIFPTDEIRIDGEPYAPVRIARARKSESSGAHHDSKSAATQTLNTAGASRK